MHIRLISAVVLLNSTLLAASEPKALSIGNATFRLGMSRHEVELEAKRWGCKTPEVSLNVLAVYCGSYSGALNLDDDYVVNVSRSWLPSKSKGEALVRELPGDEATSTISIFMDSMKSFIADGVVMVKLKEITKPNSRTKILSFETGKHDVWLMLSEDNGAKRIEILEAIDN